MALGGDEMRNVDARHGIVGQEHDSLSDEDAVQSALQTKRRRRAAVAAGVYDRLAVGCGHFRYAPRRAERFPSPPYGQPGRARLKPYGGYRPCLWRLYI